MTSEAGTLDVPQRGRRQGALAGFKIDAPLRCSPTIAAGRVMLAGCDSLLHIIDVADGKEIAARSRSTARPAPRPPCAASACTSAPKAARSSPSTCRPTTSKPAVAWTYRDPQSRPTDPRRRRRHRQIGRLRLARQSDLRPRSGDRRTKSGHVPTRSRVESSPVIAGDRVVAATTAAMLYVLDVATGEVKWEYDAGGSFTASPAVVDGRIILGNGDGTLYCFGAKTRYDRRIQHRGQQRTQMKKRNRCFKLVFSVSSVSSVVNNCTA